MLVNDERMLSDGTFYKVYFVPIHLLLHFLSTETVVSSTSVSFICQLLMYAEKQF